MYTQYLEHAYFGKLYYTVDLRNWNRQGYTVEENIALGPLFVIELRRNNRIKSNLRLIAHGPSLEEALERLVMLLDIKAELCQELPPKYSQ